MNIEGLGESLIAQLIASGLVRDYADVYALTADTVAGLTSTSDAQRRQGDRAARSARRTPRKVVEQIDRSRQATSSGALIYGLGIRHVGERGAQVLARAFGSMDALCAATVEQLQQTHEIGPVLAESVRELARRAAQPGAGRPAARRRRPHGGAAEERARATPPGPLTGKTYVLTGTLASMTREEADGRARAAGRQGRRLGQQEDDGRDRRRRAGQQGRQGRGARRADAG